MTSAEDLQVRVHDEAVGLVTVTDAWEAITGDLEDPLDEQVPPARLTLVLGEPKPL